MFKLDDTKREQIKSLLKLEAVYTNSDESKSLEKRLKANPKIHDSEKRKELKFEAKRYADNLLDILEDYLDEHFLTIIDKGTEREEIDFQSRDRSEINNEVKKLNQIASSSSQLSKRVNKLDVDMKNRLSEFIALRLANLRLPSPKQHIPISPCVLLDIIADESKKIALDFGVSYKNKFTKPLQDLNDFWILTLKKEPPPMTRDCEFNQLAAIILDSEIEVIQRTRLRD